jgi:hypothetical protein
MRCWAVFRIVAQGWWWLVLENCAAGDLYRIMQANGPVRDEGWLVSQVGEVPERWLSTRTQ